MQNRLFVINKPKGVSSNFYLREVKRRYGVKKAGFSGTLDPFAKGSLVVAFGKYTKLFKYLKKTPKKYRATIWMGVQSDSLDIENVISIENAEPLDAKIVEDNIKKLMLPLPPASEQEAIVKFVQSKLALCDKLEAEITATEQHTKNLSTAILQEVFDRQE